MSEMLDDILSLENMSLAVAKVCSNKGAGGVDGMVSYQGAHKGKEIQAYACTQGRNTQAQRRSEETRDTYGGGQGDTTGDSTEAVTYV